MYYLDPNNIIQTEAHICVFPEIIHQADGSDLRDFVPKLVPIYDADECIKDYGKIEYAKQENDDFILSYIFGDPFGFCAKLQFLVEGISNFTDPEEFQVFIIDELNKKINHYESHMKDGD